MVEPVDSDDYEVQQAVAQFILGLEQARSDSTEDTE